MKQTVSVCIITKNEESNIERCLKSVKDIADEIVLVDTGSTDKTVEIAKHYTDKIHYFKWIDDFSAAKNEAIKYASSDYILFLDADEALEPLSNFDEVLENQSDFYTVEIKNFLNQTAYKMDKTIRLFKNTESIYYVGLIHENLMGTSKGTVSDSKIRINHYGYIAQEYAQKGKDERNLKLLEKEYTLRPTSFAAYNLGIYHFNKGLHDIADKYFIQSLDKNPSGHYVDKLDVFFVLNSFSLGQIDKGLKHLETLRVLTEYKLYLKALGYSLSKRYMESFESLNALKTQKSGPEGYVYSESFKTEAQVLESKNHLLTNNPDKALEVLKSLDARNPLVISWGFDLLHALNWPQQNIETFLIKECGVDSQVFIAGTINSRSPIMAAFKSFFVSDKTYTFIDKLYSKAYMQAFELWSDDSQVKTSVDLVYLMLGLKHNNCFLESSQVEHTLADKNQLSTENTIKVLQRALAFGDIDTVELIMNDILSGKNEFSIMSMIDTLFMHGQAEILHACHGYIDLNSCKDLCKLYVNLLTGEPAGGRPSSELAGNLYDYLQAML